MSVYGMIAKHIGETGLVFVTENKAVYLKALESFLASQDLPMPDDIEAHIDALLLLGATFGMDALLKIAHAALHPDALAGPPAP